MSALPALRLVGQRCQCTACGEGFNRVSTFDRHRVGEFDVDRRCLTTAEMEAKGWRYNAQRFWVTGGGYRGATA